MAVTRDPIAEVVTSIRRGELVIFPTDTVYGIAARPDDPHATERLFAAKQRPRDLELPVLTATTDAARTVAVFDGRADRLAAACWPGGLTLVLPRTEVSTGWELGGDPATVGVRIPHHPLALAVLAATGPLAVSSANRSGAPPASDADALERTFGDSVAVYLCEDAPLEGAASTVVDLAHGPARLLRTGLVDAATIARSLGAEGALLDSPLSP
jgi:L-threonylcarbamoyladenylate synthase